MIAKLTSLKSQTSIANVKAICESTINLLSSMIYNGVTSDARSEIERVSIENLFEELSKYPDDKLVSEWLTNEKRIYAIKHLGIKRAVTNLLEKEGKHQDTLAAILEDFREKLDTTPEILLYESFISAISGYTFLPAVNTELDAVAKKVKQYKNDIDISKIIEVMKGTRSNYLLPLIEDVVEDYLSNKTESTKHLLKETLMKFSYDEFIRDIINLVQLDATQFQLEYANAACDIEDRLFSPIMYLGESEVLFNVKGTYYIKKTNHINKLKKDEVKKIDENFKAICDVINSPSVEITKKDIKVFVNNDSATITDDKILINEQEMTPDQLYESAKIAEWSGKTDFFNTVNILRENFNEIAELDFVKRVYLKENENYAADIFKLRENIFITTFDPINNKSTFYRNINPIQAEKVMMEHMRFDVSKTFEDILPNKEKILLDIDDTKKEYSDYITTLEGKIEDFSEESGEVAEAVVAALNEELDVIKNDYKDYLNDVERFTSAVDENLIITVQDDQTNKTNTVVIPSGASSAKGEEGNNGEDAEGDSFGTEVGMSNLPADSPSSAITFDDDKAELLSDAPSMDNDEVNLGADEIEAKADVENAKKDAEGGEEGEEKPGDLGDVEKPEEKEDELNLGDEEKNNVEIEDPGESEETEEEKKKKEESVGPPQKDLERTNFKKDKNPNDISDATPGTKKKVFLKRPKVAKKANLGTQNVGIKNKAIKK